MMRCDDLCCIFQQSIDQIQQNWLKQGGKTIRRENDRHMNSIWNKEELLGEWKESLIVPIYKKGR
jgi:hypothetical protein